MKALKYVFFLVLILIIGLAIYIAVQPNSFEVTRTRTINAPTAVIYDNVIDFKNWEAWSSWAESDPDLKIMLPEQTKGIDGSYSWEDKDGIGRMQTIEIVANSSIKQEMQIADFPKSDVSWNLKTNTDGSTDVTWTISGKDLPFGFKAFSVISGGIEKQIGPHYERSLEKLDSIVVANMNKFEVTVNGITEYGGGFYLYRTTNATTSNISLLMGQQFGSISKFMGQNSIPNNGMPFTIYHDMDMEKGTVIMSNALPVKEKITVPENSPIGCDYISKLKVLKVTLKGNYTNLGSAWETSMKYLVDNNLEQSDAKPFEIYTTDPGYLPNPSHWITEIYIPIK